MSRADCSSWLVTSGTDEVFGPFETLRVIVAPCGAVPLGLWLTTVSAGWSLSTFVRLTANPSFCNAALAWSKGRPVTEGTLIAAGPLETLILTREP